MTTPYSAAPAQPAAAMEPLRRLLARVRRRTWLWVWIESLAWLAILAAATFWITLLFDWWVEPPVAVRLAALAVAAAGLAWIVATKLVARLSTPLTDASLALLVERHDPRFGDSLSTAISLADRPREADASSPHDPELAARTTARAGALADGVRLGGLFRGARLAWLALGATAALSTVGTLAALRSDVAGLWVRRMTRLSNEPWPRRVRLAIEGFTDGRRLVARGSDVEIVVHAEADGPPPELVDLRSRGPDGWRSRRMGTRGGAGAGGQTFVHTLAGVSGDLDLEVRGGDARLTGLRLLVAEAPALADLSIEYEPPAYLGGGFRPVAASRVVRVPRGSRVRLTCTSTKPLGAAVVRGREGRPAGSTTPAQMPRATPDEVVTVAVAPEGRVLSSLTSSTGTSPAPNTLGAMIDALDDDLAVVIEFTDTDGLVNRQPIEWLLSPVPDERPQVAMTPRGMPAAITPAGRLLLTGTIIDDHGLAEAAIEIGRGPAADQTAAPSADAPSRATRLPVEAVRNGAPLVEFATSAPHEVALGPLALQPGERLAVTVTARDHCPVGDALQEGRGDTWLLDVVTPEALRALLEAREILLRRRFESAIDDLEQARTRLAMPAAPDRGDDAPDLDPTTTSAEAAARTAGETADLAEAFRTIHLELETNGLVTPEIEERLIRQIAAPLSTLASRDLPDLDRICRSADRTLALERTDAVLGRLRAVLARMIELESFNQLVERLRDVIRLQEQIRTDTLEEQKRRGRALLQRP